MSKKCIDKKNPLTSKDKGVISKENLLHNIQRLDDLGVSLLIIHLEVGKKFSALCNHRKKTTSCGIILLVILKVLGDLINTLRENSDLHLWRTSVLSVCLEFIDNLLLVCFLEWHGG